MPCGVPVVQMMFAFFLRDLRFQQSEKQDMLPYYETEKVLTVPSKMKYLYFHDQAKIIVNVL
ncbi:hypothetical protein J2Z65_006839 [Paenibacillus aceris]|uniref:Uncharacterized protein n=1 Tax=Paenibacillus aceris TaxID=869555 RepID=A0ABS4I9G5_9BACL|nr:hypothetical protein [Paenibacillus aceris]